LSIEQEELEWSRRQRPVTSSDTNGVKAVTFDGQDPSESTLAESSSNHQHHHINNNNNVEALKRLRRSELVQQLLDDAQANDQKTIQELAREVKRLTALLPREVIDAQDAVVAVEAMEVEEEEQQDVLSQSIVTPDGDKVAIAIDMDRDSDRDREKNHQVVGETTSRHGLCWRVCQTLAIIVASLIILLFLTLELIPTLLATN
jgi:hypothetical protein